MSATKAKRARRAINMQRAAVWDGVLRSRKSEFVEVVDTIETAAAYVLRRFFAETVRDMATFRPIKTKDRGRLRLAAAAHLLGAYPTPKHLQDVWTISPDDYRRAANQLYFRGGYPRAHFAETEIEMRERWYAAVATGKSLYKAGTRNFLTKKETHAFLTCPLKFSFEETLIYAICKSHTQNLGVLTRLVKSRLIEIGPLVSANRQNINDDCTDFWKDLVRFFAVHSHMSISQINDLLDYIKHCRNVTPGYTIKGRTLDSLTDQMVQWHRDNTRVTRMGNRVWSGSPICDAEYDGRKPEVTWTKLLWEFTQIKSSKALAEEGNKMHHCVYSYQSYCVSGARSIWSLKRAGERVVTIEVNNNVGRIVQVRGYANRLARDDELAAINVWAGENGLRVGRTS